MFENLISVRETDTSTDLAPSLPVGHRWTIMMVVGRNWTPAMNSAKASSPSANKNGDSPKVMPLMRRTWPSEKNPFRVVVAMYTFRQLQSIM